MTQATLDPTTFVSPAGAQAAAIRAPTPPADPSIPERALRFRAGCEPFAIDILRVREIRSWEAPTRVPGAGDELQGVIDLRGTVIPVIDLRRRLGQRPAAAAGITVVAELEGALVGLAVDAVDDVQEVTSDQVRAVPPLRGPAAGHVAAMLATDRELVQLLDLDRVLEGAPRSRAALG